MHGLDFIVLALPLLAVLITGLYARRHVRSVADFVSANRAAGRYLLSIASGELTAGAVVFVAGFEVFARGGFSVGWWGALGVPIGIILRNSGFVYFRYRETRAMTLAQFFEIRYSKAFRLFAGVVGFLAGILNFGVGPAIGARVMVYLLGLPETLHLFGLAVPSYTVLMAAFLSLSLFIALSGGVITVMVINTLEGIMAQLFYLVIIFSLLAVFSWPEMHDALMVHPPNQSLVDPFQTSGVKDFNIWYVLMGIFLGIYGTMAWQNAGNYNGAGLTPHEGRMGNVLSGWRDMGKGAIISFLGLCAFTYLHNPVFAAGAAQVHAAASQITNLQAREQMTAPLALAHFLPVGVRGVFAAVLLMGIFGGDSTHLNSWGSILVQDVLVPLRRRPFGPRMHLWILRASICGVACFAFLFGTFFQISDYINMWWSVTTAVFVGGAGAAIIGGLYWKKGTTAAAWCAFMVGSGLSVTGIILQQVAAAHGKDFFLNGIKISFFSSLLAIATYVTVSLLTCRDDFNLERMLHRGVYAAPVPAGIPKSPSSRVGWGRWIGLDENFTTGDKWITGLLFGWSMFWFALFAICSSWNLVAPWSEETWARYFCVTGIGLPIFFAVVTGLWFTWGGVRDMLRLFRRLKQERVNNLDDGTVVGHRNLDEIVAGQKEEHSAAAPSPLKEPTGSR